MPLIIFLVFYCGLVVVGNVCFAIFGRGFIPGYPIGFFDFPETFSSGFWALLMLPFVLVPPTYFIFRSLLAGSIARAVAMLPTVNSLGYAVLLAVLFALVVRGILASDALNLSSEATSDITSIEARFEIQNRLGFWMLVVLQAFLPFTAFVGLIAAMRSSRAVWWVLAIIAIIGTTFGLVALNMKWPVVVFYVGITIAVFSFSPRWVYISTAVSIVTLLAVYFAISAFVFRVVLPLQINNSRPEATIAPRPSLPPAARTSKAPIDGAERTPVHMSTAVELAQLYVKLAIVRLAVGFPFYYHVFTTEGPVCGGVLEQAKPGPQCRPSKIIYSRMFPHDQFQNRGTAGNAVHLSAYALGGWPYAVGSLIAAALVLSVFSCFPLDGSAVTSALRTVGAIAGYHLATIPGEGVFFYDHGLVWVCLLIAVLKLLISAIALVRDA